MKEALATSWLLALVMVISVSGGSGALGQSLPDRVLIGYWHNWGWSPNNLTLAQIPAEYDVINIAFATPATAFGANMIFTPDPSLYPVAQAFVTDVQALQDFLRQHDTRGVADGRDFERRGHNESSAHKYNVCYNFDFWSL